MEERGPSGLRPGQQPGKVRASDGAPDLIEQIHRELERLDMPCACKDQLDQTIVAIEVWQRLKLRKDLASAIEADYGQLLSGLSFLGDLARIGGNTLSPDEMQDHAESLKFLADTADRCARRLNELSRVTGQE
ncbi:hypothetical protein [Roseibium sp.]|uniref:hypothetical protein n=1 Tax=Roseibium sp. TaxID=1936156 RepID=UPI003BAEA8AD